jgi:hypothetical protein
MKLALRHIFTLIVAGLLCGSPVVGAASAQQRAITGIVSGKAIQKVGFRAIDPEAGDKVQSGWLRPQ